jgi:exopolysaccharide biosynthesis polyprenyl glycosylphosphotransferase
MSGNGKSPLQSLSHFLLGPLAAAGVIALASRGTDYPPETGLLAFVLFAGSAVLFRSEARWANLLPFMGVAYGAVAPLVGLGAILLLKATTGVPEAEIRDLVAATLVGAAISIAPAVLRRHRVRGTGLRVALIGSVAAAERLAADLENEGPATHRLVGRIALEDQLLGLTEQERVPTLATLSDVDRAVAEYRIDLLVVTDEAPPPRVFDRLATSCLRLSVRVCGLTGFYEDRFGRVPVSGINAAWFQYLMHPRYRPTPSTLKRGVDLCVAGTLGVVTLPLLTLLALLVRLDGGPSLFCQTRVGEGGRLFTVYKLRTMRVGSSSAAQWASPGDPRITSVGAFLRRTHLDELPQLFNVLQGDMSLVGPRPEQPAFVAHLEKELPFYTERHLIRPGITGWAQVRCGYAGSDIGSTRKLCHDLFYLKHRTMLLDLVIMAETLRTLVADRQFATKPAAATEPPAPQEARMSANGDAVAALLSPEAQPGEADSRVT